MNIAPHTLVGDIVANLPAAIPTLDQFGIDCCCGGSRVPLVDACRERAVDARSVIAELRALAETRRAWPSAAWAEAPIPALINYIVAHYHAPMRRDLAVIGKLMQQVLLRHGAPYPELPPLADECRNLSGELLAHTAEEESVCFPYILDLVAGCRRASLKMRAMLPRLTREHLSIGDGLRRMRELTNVYRAPHGACVSFRALFGMLANLEQQLHQHLHLENNILFPRAADLEASCQPA